VPLYVQPCLVPQERIRPEHLVLWHLELSGPNFGVALALPGSVTSLVAWQARKDCPTKRIHCFNIMAVIFFRRLGDNILIRH
jgi:hypothetical protein